MTARVEAASRARRRPEKTWSLSRAAVVSGALNVLGSALGLVRDLLLAAYFGASGTMDAFLVAWTVPETASPLLIEDAMAFLLVPAFSRAGAAAEPTAAEPTAGVAVAEPAAAGPPAAGPDAARSAIEAGAPGAPDPEAGAPGSPVPEAVNRLVRATLFPATAVLTAVCLLGILAAPWTVDLLAPGVAHHRLAVTCVRLIWLSVLPIGLTGYVSAALRSRHVFGPPAAIYIAFNSGLVALVWLFHGRGVAVAAAGVVAGSVLMVALQAPWFLMRVGGLRPRRRAESADGPGRSVRSTVHLAFAAVAPVGVFTLTRQSQTFVERFLGSNAPTGTISHLNYAQKVAQVPMAIVMVVAVVSFPALSRALAGGRRREAGRRLAADLRVSAAAILAGTAYLIACAPQVVRAVFQRGAFTTADTRATAEVIRLYSLGLLGQVLVGVTVRVYFAAASGSRRRTTSMWLPARAMAVGLAVTVVAGGYAAPRWGGPGIAAANALGISATAVLLLIRVGRRAGFSLRRFTAEIAGLAAVALAAGLAAWAAVTWSGLPAVAGALAGGLTVAAVFAACLGAARRLPRPRPRPTGRLS